MKLFKLPRRGGLIAAALIGLAGSIACEELGPDPELATMMIYLPGNDTVFVDLAFGDVMSGPITMFTDIDISTEFFANDGTPDSRVTEQRFRLDVTPANPALVSYTSATPFSGRLTKLAVGNTSLEFALLNLETQENLFAYSVDVSIN